MRFRIPWLASILALSACSDAPAIDWYEPDIPAEQDTRLVDASDRDVPTDCVPEHHKACCGDNVCWFDRCGNAGRVVATCEEGCSNALCKNCTPRCQGLECGDDECGGDCGFCDHGYCQGPVWMLPATCIAGTCKGGGAAVSCDDTNACTDDACLSPVGCVHTPRAGSCDDGDPCTAGDTCSGGICTPGAPRDCNDSEPCTIDSCLAGYGCKNVNVSNGTVCQQGACSGLTLTTPMICTMGVCGGGGDMLSCDDGLQCTVDACDPIDGCSNTPATGWCLIEGGCYQANQFMNGNACRKCSPAVSSTTWTLLNDGDPCGGGEFCFGGYCGCVPDCTGRECGDNGCGGSCGSCADGQCNGLSWTPPQTCSGSTCVGAGTTSCNDGLACTNDSCSPSTGCLHTLVAGTCRIDGVCYADGNWDTSNPCRVCSASTRQDQWSMLGEGAPCGSAGQTCQDGFCGCLSDCLGRECGDDGCGGSCGDCDFGMDCGLGGGCAAAPLCQPYPSTWAPIGAVSYLQTPASKTAAGTVCFDYTGEGTGDSGLAGLAGQVNPALVDMINDGEFAPLFEFPNVGSFTGSGVFQLRGLLGQSTAVPTVVGGDYRVDPISYASDCKPVNRFDDARITASQLSATTDLMWTHLIPLISNDEPIGFVPQRDVRLKATVVEGGSGGVVLKNGVLSAIIMKDEITSRIDRMQAICDSAPEGQEPTYCGYLGMMRQLIPTLCDLHRTDAGEYLVKSTQNPANALSVCWQFETAKGSVVGMMPR